jgi:hypothetical protein
MQWASAFVMWGWMWILCGAAHAAPVCAWFIRFYPFIRLSIYPKNIA